MRIIINTTSVFKGGAEQVAISIIKKMSLEAEHQFHLFACDNILKNLKPADYSDNFTVHRFLHRPGSGLRNYLYCTRKFEALEKEINPDCVVTTSGHGYWRPKAAHIAGFNIPHYIYPESPYFQKISFKQRCRLWLKKNIDSWFYRRNVDHFFTQTDDVNQRLRTFMGSNQITTITNNCSDLFYQEVAPTQFLRRKSSAENFHLLMLSAYYPHKNFEIIEQVVQRLRKQNIEDVRFVLTLSESVFKNTFKQESIPYIINLGPVKIKDCPALYRECDALFLPSLLECFSASYPEAMASEVPILTSNLGFAHTVCKDAALYFDPLNADEITASILKTKQDEQIRKKLVTAGLNRLKFFDTPLERANKIMKICKSLTDEKVPVS